MPLKTRNLKSVIAPRKVLIYGNAGVGKSTWASHWPKPVLIQTEEGSHGLDIEAFDLVTSIEDVIQHIDALKTEDHEFETLVIDSLDWLEPMIWQRVCQQGSKENIDDFGFGKGFMLAAEKWSAFTGMLTELSRAKQMHIVLIAHEAKMTIKDPRFGAYDQFSPKLEKKANAIICEWCDDVLFATYPIATKSDPTNTNKKQVRNLAVSAGDRVIYTTYEPSRIAKNRLSNCPDELSLNFDDYWQYVPKSLEKPVC